MILSNLLKSKIEAKNRIPVLVGVVLFEILISVFVWKHTKSSIVLGFLVKNGNTYVLAWKDEDTGYQSRTYTTLREALKVAHTLNLSPGRNPLADNDIERVWLSDRSGAYVLMWKTLNYALLHQLTFQSQDDALYFERAFRAGSYTPSPYGHSVLFIPTRTN